MCGRRFADAADWPVRRDPFSGSVGEDGGEPDDPGGLIDRGALHGRDLMLAQRLADDVKPAQQRSIAERSFCYGTRKYGKASKSLLADKSNKS